MLYLLPEGKITFYNPCYCYYLQVHPLFGKAESKNKLLRSVAGGGVDQIGQLQARWDKFEMMMESHELMVKEQVGYAQGQARIRVDTSSNWYCLFVRIIMRYWLTCRILHYLLKMSVFLFGTVSLLDTTTDSTSGVCYLYSVVS